MSARLFSICALGYALAMILSISGSSLWTDEAFSAWLASHKTAGSLATSLFAGSSSDLQSGLYYVYLFLWVKLFGGTELALRAANVPFILMFSVALVWASWCLFNSRRAWLAAGMLPFLWQYASEARGYMALLAFSAGGLGALLAFIRADASSRNQKFAWICLSCILLGSMFHILFLLAIMPMLWIAALAYLSDDNRPRWREWIVPLVTFALPFLALAGFLIFTFTRSSIGYLYPRPGLRRMASVLYELVGLFNFGPNRKLSLDFHSYVVPLATAGLGLVVGVIVVVWPALRNRANPLVMALASAALVCFVEVITVCFALGKQVDARHLAALVPIFLFLLLGLISQAPPRTQMLAIFFLGGTWLIADLRGARLPEYQKEDYRAAARLGVEIHHRTGAIMALASDPVGFAYYGLDVIGPKPCFPMVTSCQEAFSLVPWRHTAEAIDANLWSPSRIRNWLSHYAEENQPVEILVQRDRAHSDSSWWPILAEYSSAPRTRIHGFEIVLLNAPVQQ